MDKDTIARLRGLLDRATKGPWELDSERNEDCQPKHFDYFIGGDVGGKWSTIFDTVNSDNKLIEEEFDEAYHHAWDAIGKANGELVVAMHEALPALLSIAERAADVEGVYGAVNMTPGVAWLKTDEQKAVATAVSRYVLGGE